MLLKQFQRIMTSKGVYRRQIARVNIIINNGRYNFVIQMMPKDVTKTFMMISN